MPVAAPSSSKRITATTALTCAAAWTLIAFVMIDRDLLIASGDDNARIVLAMRWAREHFFFVDGYYWLPLPVWYYGAWRQASGWFGDFVHWYIPASTFTMMLASWLLMLLANAMYRDERVSENARVAGVFVTLIVSITIPFTWCMTATNLAETVFMAGLAGLGLLLVRFRQRPSGWKWLGILLVCEVLMLTRYEGWPVAFLAWVVACQVGHQGPAPRPRFQWQLVAGLLALSVLPLTLMGIHATYSLDPFHIFKVPYIAAKMTPEISNATTGFRIQYLSMLAVGQGWVVLPLFVLGLIGGRRRPETWMIAAIVLFLWLSYYQMAVTNTFGSNPPDRYCVPALWLSAPIAARGAVWAGTLRPRWAAWASRLALAAAIVVQVNLWSAWNFGGHAHAPELLKITNRLADSARRRNGYFVIKDLEFFGNNINLIRIYMGLDRVVVERWWNPPQPVKGEIFYLTPAKIEGLEPEQELAGEYLYVFDEWPRKE